MYILYTRERCYFSLVCTVEKAIDVFKVKANVQKGALRFQEKINNRCVDFIQFTFPSIIVIR